MNVIEDAIDEFLDSLNSYKGKLDYSSLEEFIELLHSSDRVFIYGAGRAGLVGRTFTQRMMHLGLPAYYVGETLTPALKPGDLFVAISGSGKTASTIALAKRAREVGGVLVAITSKPDSPLTSIPDKVIIIQGKTKGDETVSLLPLSTLFLDTVQIVLDALIADLMKKMDVKEEDTLERHANVE